MADAHDLIARARRRALYAGTDDETTEDLFYELSDALETWVGMWEELRRYMKPRMGACDMETTMAAAVDKRFSERMHAIELQFLPGTPDDPAEIDRRLQELRGDVDE